MKTLIFDEIITNRIQIQEECLEEYLEWIKAEGIDISKDSFLDFLEENYIMEEFIIKADWECTLTTFELKKALKND